MATKDEDAAANGQEKTKKRRSVSRSFPAATFEDALLVPRAIQKYAAGQQVRRLTLFDHLGKAPSSGHSRQLVTNASRYGLIEGNYNSEHLKLTPDGAKVTGPGTPPREKRRLEFKLAISEIKPFRELYEKLQNNRLPSKKVLTDYLLDNGYSETEVSECVDTFIVNAKQVGVLKTLSGAETVVPIEHALEETPAAPKDQISGDGFSDAKDSPPPLSGPSLLSPPRSGDSSESWDTTCFYITPIGEDGSEHRQHSDLFLRHIVEPALEEFGLRVVRADHIGKPGMITGQVIEHIVKSRLVVADLSYHNPNVFYELALRHATRRPTVQIIQRSHPGLTG
ncbi:hypothetical protein RQM47_14215 [Rubrivirga sp. S365]|uniref:hypothetical protein n=1 Tax=Rubrivirga sp. S365 TaxID=3076080 RepID=UPI0028C8216A|nr:hypothetical protein [Rubrivirga sp. S365]MDT7857802.1 hypothetical protein [Rubrivirga sp. S365]